jgi:hypothetical protein
MGSFEPHWRKLECGRGRGGKRGRGEGKERNFWRKLTYMNEKLI